MLNKKIKLNIDIDGDRIHVYCKPISTNETLNKDDNENILNIQLDLSALKTISSYIPTDIIINNSIKSILNELMKGLIDKHFLTCLDEYLSTEDPIYETIMERLYNDEKKFELYKCYFDEESLIDLSNQISNYFS